MLISQSDLEAANPRTLTRSARSLSTLNVHSVSEAAALAGAGPAARLLGPRVAVGPVTCALAESRALAESLARALDGATP
jgi:cobalt-precorrin 5A hydrolase